MSAYGAESGHAAPSQQGSVARGAGLDLTIHSVKESDAGKYHCALIRFAEQPTRPVIGSALRLVVNASPILLAPVDHQVNYGRIGDSLTVECEADGIPPPEITWTKNNKIVSTGPRLHIDRLDDTHKGIYICLAVNVEGQAMSHLEVKFSRKPLFDHMPSNKSAVEGSNVFWRCHVDAPLSGVQYFWMFQDRPIRTTQTGLRSEMKDGDLFLRNVRKLDSGWYVCAALDPSGEQSRTSAFLNVLYPPEVLPSHRQILTIGYGQNSSLVCPVDGNPKPNTYTWSKNGHFVTKSTEDSILIRGERESDGGIFGCQAENSVGRSPIVETHVIIAEPPAFITRPPLELRVHEGAPVDVSCSGFGDPLPIVYWVHLERRISSATLSFPSVSHNDYGMYECIVSNAISTISSSMKLIVERTRPQAAVIDSVDCVGEEAMVINWIPGFDGSYPQSFVVHYGSDKTLSDKTLLTTSTSATVGDLTSFTKYRIHIESRNQKGSTNSSSVEKYVCSTLAPPSNVLLVGDSELRWDPVDYAQSYRVESRYDNMSPFKEIGEVLDPIFRLSPDFHQGQSFRVRSLRPPYQPSLHSRPVKLGSVGGNLPSMWWTVFGGFVFLFLFIALFLYYKYGNYIGRRRRKDNYYNDYAGSSPSHPQTETLWKVIGRPSVILGDNAKCSLWHISGVDSELQEQSQWTQMFERESTIPVPLEIERSTAGILAKLDGRKL
uniref:Down syndrome cell adhesion molecule-like protein Dscam2 n=1 Tax=Haemonchus contortus TaxID=6289 RepID=A0A7I5EER5_HAECO